MPAPSGSARSTAGCRTAPTRMPGSARSKQPAWILRHAFLGSLAQNVAREFAGFCLAALVSVDRAKVNFQQGFSLGECKPGVFAQSGELGFPCLTLQSHRPPRLELCQFLTVWHRESLTAMALFFFCSAAISLHTHKHPDALARKSSLCQRSRRRRAMPISSP